MLPALAIAQTRAVSRELPAAAAAQLRKSLAASTTHAEHVWRDTAPRNEDGTVNAYVEISRGDRRKWEFDMAANRRAIDRMIPEQIGGYPVNYGFVPQTVSYDGDPFDVLVLGPPIEGGRMVRGAVVGLMLMEDEKGYDAKVVVSPVVNGRPTYALAASDRDRISEYFRHYKEFEPANFSKVPGWGSVDDGFALIHVTHAFFAECRSALDGPCRLRR
jgi:inorganic pyrophosphatase